MHSLQIATKNHRSSYASPLPHVIFLFNICYHLPRSNVPLLHEFHLSSVWWPITFDMPPLSFHPESAGSHSTEDEGTFRVCSAVCAYQAHSDPPHYHAAACVNAQAS